MITEARIGQSESMNPEQGRIPELAEIQDRVQELHEEYRNRQVADLEERIEAIIQGGLFSADVLRAEVTASKKRLETDDPYQQIIDVIGNFFTRIPKTGYREKYLTGNGGEQLNKSTQLLADLDQLIRDGGYDARVDQLGDMIRYREPENLRILASLFIAMVDKGYSAEELSV